ncbi:MAG TPA: LacI family DNA-binding transcriptional regulator [Victivallales bacterium]|nr:LacI family DNA-binding transcriptional regulator [Victivallales bacterium]
MDKKITLKDIADECGVTVQTASRILNSEYVKLYNSETVRKVKETAGRLGYRPNAFAQFIKTGKFHSISLLLSPEISFSSFSIDYLILMEQKLAERNYNLLLNVLPGEHDIAEDKIPRIFKENLVDGALVAITHAIPEWLESLIMTINVPIVWIGSKHDKDCVHHDDFKAAYDLTLHYAQKGFRKIFYVDMVISKDNKGPLHFSVKDREEGYLKAMKKLGLKTFVMRPKKPLNAIDFAGYAKTILSSCKPPFAFLCYDFENSGRNILYTANNLGLRFHKDFELTCFSDKIHIENSTEIPAILPRKIDIVEAAVNMLFEKIERKNDVHKPVIIPFAFYGYNCEKNRILQNEK